jgi:hypothetical protein
MEKATPILHDIKRIGYELEKALSRYRQLHGAFPKHLEQLVSDRIIENLPENPFKTPFDYDSETGIVNFNENN